jgi:hypothetical protein
MQPRVASLRVTVIVLAIFARVDADEAAVDIEEMNMFLLESVQLVHAVVEGMIGTNFSSIPVPDQLATAKFVFSDGDASFRHTKGCIQSKIPSRV